jgi:inhibitor of KinA
LSSNNLPISCAPYGDAAILISWQEEISVDILKIITAVDEKIQQEDWVLETIPAYNSLTVIVSITIKPLAKAIATCEALLKSIDVQDQEPAVLWELPVCYDKSLALDLDEVATQKEISAAEIIASHSAVTYTVHFFGFLPGFMYLGGLDDTLHTPRKAMPEMKVPKGAVAIGGKQTGIYPYESPGGWHIIGNCPIQLFDEHNTTPCFINPGDKVKFIPISLEDYENEKYECVKVLLS